MNPVPSWVSPLGEPSPGHSGWDLNKGPAALATKSSSVAMGNMHYYPAQPEAVCAPELKSLCKTLT